MTAALRQCPGQVLQKQIPHTTNFQEVSCHRSILLTALKGGGEPQQPQDKMLSIPNYRNANQNKETSNPTSQNGHPHKSINNKCGTVPGGKGIPLHVGRWECTLATATPNDSL